MKKKILIVGGTGFIGYHLSKQCIKKKWNVTSLSKRKPKRFRFLKSVKYLNCDISNKNNLKKKLKEKYNYVVNLGGDIDHNNRNKTFKSHYIGCKNLADFFKNRKIDAFIQMGSSSEYGRLKSPHDESFLGSPLSAYGSAKLKSTKYLLKLFKEDKFPAIILRLYQAYGPKQDINRLIPIIIFNSLKDKKFPCSHGKQFRDFIYIDDVISVILKCLYKKKLFGNIFNIGFGKPIKIKKIINTICNKNGRGTPLFGLIKLRRDETLKVYPKIKKTKKLLNWKPKVSLYKGLKKTYISYQRDINKKIFNQR